MRLGSPPFISHEHKAMNGTGPKQPDPESGLITITVDLLNHVSVRPGMILQVPKSNETNQIRIARTVSSTYRLPAIHNTGPSTRSLGKEPTGKANKEGKVKGFFCCGARRV